MASSPSVLDPPCLFLLPIICLDDLPLNCKCCSHCIEALFLAFALLQVGYIGITVDLLVTCKVGNPVTLRLAKVR